MEEREEANEMDRHDCDRVSKEDGLIESVKKQEYLVIVGMRENLIIIGRNLDL